MTGALASARSRYGREEWQGMQRPMLECPVKSQEPEERVSVCEEVEVEKERIGTSELGRRDDGS